MPQFLKGPYFKLCFSPIRNKKKKKKSQENMKKQRAMYTKGSEQRCGKTSGCLRHPVKGKASLLTAL